jgi:IS30 family transposase
LCRTIAMKLRLNWSPEQIAGWLKRAYPQEEYNQVSHETIYRSPYVQTRGVLKRESCFSIFDRSAPCADPGTLPGKAMGAGTSRT